MSECKGNAAYWDWVQAYFFGENGLLKPAKEDHGEQALPWDPLPKDEDYFTPWGPTEGEVEF